MATTLGRPLPDAPSTGVNLAPSGCSLTHRESFPNVVSRRPRSVSGVQRSPYALGSSRAAHASPSLPEPRRLNHPRRWFNSSASLGGMLFGINKTRGFRLGP